jgi:hypothetical protein
MTTEIKRLSDEVEEQQRHLVSSGDTERRLAEEKVLLEVRMVELEEQKEGLC